MKTYFFILTTGLLLLLTISGCKKDEVFPDPYGGGQSLLTIKFANKVPTPSRGVAGQDMTFYVTGLQSANAKEIKFLASDLEAAIKNITDSTITITLPQNVSSGAASLRVDGQVFQGPNIYIEGKLYRDATFKSGVGTNGYIADILPDNNQYILAGYFSSYNLGGNLSGMTKINAAGEKIDGLTVGYATSSRGSVSSLLRLPDSDLMIGGAFSMFDSISDMNSITRLNSSGGIRTRIVDLYVAPENSDPSYATDTVPQFTGNLFGTVSKLYYHNDQITAVGNISGFFQYFYERSTKDNKLISAMPTLPVVRMSLTGEFDSSYLFNKELNRPPAGFNGSISGSYMQDDGKLILVGSFTSLNGVSCNRIVRLNVDGSIDPAFRAGSAANEAISGITYNSTTQKYIIVGNFTSYNGVSINNIAVLNTDGSLYSNFKTAGAFTGGRPTFAGQLSNGLIVVNGSFEKYNNITRRGLMILNADGSLAANYNATGAFNGAVIKMLETKSGIGGLPAVILVGVIDSFEGERCGGILKLVFGN